MGLVIAAPAAALVLAAFVVWRTVATDPMLAGDVRRLGVALAPIVCRRTLLLSVLVCCGAAGVLFFRAVHAVVG